MRKVYADSRCSSRYPAVRTAVYLGWWEEPEFRTSLAELRNLSHGGALLRVAGRPPAGLGLWLCLAGAPPGDWVEVDVVDHSVAAGGVNEVRVKFTEACPYDMFNAAVYGIPRGD